MKPRTRLTLGLLAGALLAAVLVVRLLPSNRTAAAEPPAKKAAAPAGKQGGGGGAPLPVYTYQVSPRTFQERITATGTIVADEAIDLVSELSGKAVEVQFEEGSPVKRGTVLLKLDDTELRAQLTRAQSRLALAKVQAERQQALVASGGTTRENLDTALNEVKVLEAEVELARAQLAKTELRAPFDGVIGLRYVSAGAFVTPSTRIATLQKLDTIKVEFAVAERHLDRVQMDAEVVIGIAGLSQPIAGKVYAVEPRIDEATRTLRLRARAENPGGRALPGAFATVEMALRQIPDALLVPATALVAGLNQQQVYVLEDGRAQPRRVQIGLRLAREVQIISGLEPNATVITSGQMQLRPGMPVRPVEAPRAPGSEGPPSNAAPAMSESSVAPKSTALSRTTP